MNIKRLITENKEFIINILMTTVFGGVISLLNYLFNVYLARNISEYDFGLYNASLGLTYLIQIPAIAIQSSITKKVAEKKNFDLSKFKARSLLQFTIIATIFSIIFYSFRSPISEVANLPMQFMLPLTITLFSAIVSPISKGFVLGMERILFFNILMLVETVLKFVMGYLMIRYNLDITLPILANSLPALLTMLVVLPFIKSKGKKISKESINVSYKPILLMFVTYFLINTPYTVDLILVNPDVRAEYGALSLLGKIVYFAAITIAGVMFSRLANESKSKRKKTLLISLIFTTLTGLAISACYYLFSDWIVNIVFDGQYLSVTPYIAFYGLAMTFYAVAYMIINSLLVNDSYKHIYFLVVLSILQIVLFRVNNDTLYDAFVNQLIVYGLLTLFVIVILIFNVFKNGKGKDFKKSK